MVSDTHTHTQPTQAQAQAGIVIARLSRLRSLTRHFSLHTSLYPCSPFPSLPFPSPFLPCPNVCGFLFALLSPSFSFHNEFPLASLSLSPSPSLSLSPPFLFLALHYFPPPPRESSGDFGRCVGSAAVAARAIYDPDNPFFFSSPEREEKEGEKGFNNNFAGCGIRGATRGQRTEMRRAGSQPEEEASC